MRYDEAQQVRYHSGVIAKVVVIKVQSNYNNVAANRLGVVPDTTDVALLRTRPRSRSRCRRCGSYRLRRRLVAYQRSCRRKCY